MMEKEKHDILHEFPEYKEKAHELKMSDQHFRKQYEEYHELDHEIHRIEMGSEVAGDDYLHAQKVKRAQLKDYIFQICRT